MSKDLTPTTRELHEHKINPANDLIRITADEQNPKNGNASHVYFLDYPAPPGSNAPPDAPEGTPPMVRTVISFQNGPINEVGVNGLTNEAMIVLVIDRLRGFQSSPFSCRENAVMLTKLEEALMWSHKRTLNRIARGVEGTHQK